jgi:hypothetical protein
MSGKQQPNELPAERPLAARILNASPLGVTAIIAGVVLAIFFLVRFQSLLDDVDNGDLHSAIEALEITVVAVWLAVAVWGWYLIRDGLERARAYRRLNAQDLSLMRIEQAIAEIDREKRKVQQKSRNFWDWRRGEES